MMPDALRRRKPAGYPHQGRMMNLTERFYTIYRENYFKLGKKWAREVGSFEKKNKIPFARVNREVNSQMRRFMGGENYGKYIDTLEYMILKEGLLIKDQNNNLDIPEATFNLWLE